MSIVDNLDLEKLVARAVVAGGLGLAVMGLGAGMANAGPGPRGPALPTVTEFGALVPTCTVSGAIHPGPSVTEAAVI
jgi:hypothetical protein